MKQFKVFIVFISFVLIAFSLVSFAFYLRFEPVDSPLRPFMMRSQFTKNLFRLNREGDARYLLAHSVDRILLVEQRNLLPKVEEELPALFKTFTKKNEDAKVSKINAPILYSHDFLITEEKLVNLMQMVLTEQKGYDLYIFVVGKLEEGATNTGAAYADRSIVIFADRLEELSQIPVVKEQIQRGTLIHEFGHLLGLGHVPDENCLMAEVVDAPGYDWVIRKIPQTFCPTQLEKIEALQY